METKRQLKIKNEQERQKIHEESEVKQLRLKAVEDEK